MATVRDNYTEEYYHNHSEPHRRRPTVLHFPCTVWHFGINYPPKVSGVGPTEGPRRAFAQAVKQAVLDNLGDWHIVKSFSEAAPPQARYEPIKPSFIDSFFDQVWNPTATDASGRRAENAFCFEIVPPLKSAPQEADDNKCVVRFEQHSEYLTVSVFSYFCVDNDSDGSSRLRVYRFEGSTFREIETEKFTRIPENANWSQRFDYSSKAETNPLTFLSKNGFVADPTVKIGGAKNVLEAAINGIILAMPHSIFCDFRGIFTPCEIFEPFMGRVESPDNPRLSDVFCAEGQAAFPIGHDFTPAQSFLSRIWPALAQSPIFSVEASENLVGCYMQGGHTIYLSALGAQGLRPISGARVRPLTFVIIYRPPISPARNGNAYRWRLSRLANRLIEVGVRRTASLRSLDRIRDAGAALSDIEAELESKTTEKPDIPALKTLNGRIDDIYRNFRSGSESESLSYRLARNSQNYTTMTLLIEDLGVLKIPGWYPYDHFVKRRLSSTHQNIIGLQSRLRDIEERIRTKLSFADMFPTAPQKAMARSGFTIAVTGILGLILYGAIEVIFRLLYRSIHELGFEKWPIDADAIGDASKILALLLGYWFAYRIGLRFATRLTEGAGAIKGYSSKAKKSDRS